MKRIILYVIIGLMLQSLSAQHTDRPKVAVVLSGGGAKGFSHIGVLDVLEKEGIPIDIIVGTSMGSVVGGLYSVGYNSQQLTEMCLTENWQQLLSDFVPRKQLDQYSQEAQQRYVLSIPMYIDKKPGIGSGMVRGENVLNLFCRLASNVPAYYDFRKLPISYACIGTDLNSGKEIVMNSGFLPTAIYSSMAIPGVFAPMKYKDYLLVDGGVVNNFPTDVAKEMGADIIIGVNLNKDFKARENVSTMIDLTTQLVGIMTARKDSANKALCDVLIEPNLTGYNSSSFSNDAADTLIRRGKESAMAVIDQIRSLKEKYNLQPRTITDSLINFDYHKIVSIQFSGKYSLPIKLLLEVMNLHTPGMYNGADIQKSINSLYGMGVFDRVYYEIIDQPNGKTLNVIIEERKSLDLNVGMRLNSRSVVSVALNATRKNYSNTISLLSFTADISTNPGFKFLAEMNKNNLPKLAFSLEGSYYDMIIHLSKENTYPASVYYGAAKLYTYQRLHRYSLLGAGIRQEYYIGKLFNFIGDQNIELTTRDKLISNYYVYYNFDSQDDFYYPTAGTQLYAEFLLAHDFNHKNFHPIALLKVKSVKQISSKVTLMTGLYARALINNVTSPFLGNFLTSTDYESVYYQHLPFYGLPSVWAAQQNAAIGSAGLRLNIFKRNYVTLSTNYLVQNDVIDQFDKYKGTWGFGLTYSYKTLVGPIEFTLGYSNAYGKIVATGNVGYWF